MRLARLGMLLVVWIFVAARGRADDVLATHRPMHPGNNQTVTFEATSESANRIDLSYKLFALSTAGDGTHTQTLRVPETNVATCERGTPEVPLTCTHTMAVPFPAASLVVYTATATGLAGKSSDSYAFAAGEYPWPDDAIPIRLKGNTKSKLDTVFIPGEGEENLALEFFRDKLYDVIALYYPYQELRKGRGVLNFWYSPQRGNYAEFCKFTNPPNMANLTAVADMVAFLHRTPLRDCSSRPRMSAEIDADKKAIVHESGHLLFGLRDEYCCDSKYKQEKCAPNVYASLGACEDDAANLDVPASNCLQIAYGDRTVAFWRIDPSTQPWACIMGPNQNSETSIFREACARRMTYRYELCLGGNCFPSDECP